jgi:hypothetical protein
MSYTLLQQKTVHIKKARHCHGCQREFEPGSKMQYTVSIFDGDFWAIYDCPACAELYRVVDNEWYQYDGYDPAWVFEEMRNHEDFIGKTPEEFLEYLKTPKNDE